MTNTKAQVGDLIRIVYAACLEGEYSDGDILQVKKRAGDYDNKVQVENCEVLIYDFEYVIHRKAGEEDVPKVCDIIDKITKLRNNFFQECEPQDAVNQPNHYTQGKFETIEVIEDLTSKYDDGFTAHCLGTAFKYMDRAPLKHETPIECLRKAARYLEYAIAHEQRKIDGK